MMVAPEPTEAPGEVSLSGASVRRRPFHSDMAVAVAIVVFCAGVYAVTLTFPAVPAAVATGMGPEVFPRLLLAVLVFLAGLLAFLARGKRDEVSEPVPAMVYWTALAMLAFMGVLWVVGMAAAMFLGFVGIGRLWGERRWAILIIAGLALSSSIYLLFVRAFGVPLPRGLLGQWLV